MAKIVDIAVECLMDLATASKNLDRAVTDMDSCWRHKLAAEVNKSMCELITINLRALFPQNSIFLTGTEHLPLLEISSNEASASVWGRFSVGKY